MGISSIQKVRRSGVSWFLIFIILLLSSLLNSFMKNGDVDYNIYLIRGFIFVINIISVRLNNWEKHTSYTDLNVAKSVKRLISNFI